MVIALPDRAKVAAVVVQLDGRVDPHVRQSLIENEHSYGFRDWASMWRLAWNDESAERAVIELSPDEEASGRLWERYDRLWQ